MHKLLRPWKIGIALKKGMRFMDAQIIRFPLITHCLFSMALITVHLNFSDRDKWHTAMRLMKYMSMPKEREGNCIGVSVSFIQNELS